MRHKVKKKKFDRTKEQRLALYRSLARALILEESIETTLERAKAVRSFVERLVTLGKKGDLSSRRRALELLPDNNNSCFHTCPRILVPSDKGEQVL